MNHGDICQAFSLLEVSPDDTWLYDIASVKNSSAQADSKIVHNYPILATFNPNQFWM
jgi:hypothetical protein